METLRMPFEHGDPAGPLRLNARVALAPSHPADYVEDVLVVISELVQNVTQHTTGGGLLTVSWDELSITVQVRDHDDRMPRPRRPDEHRVGGRGLLLVAGIATSWGTTAHQDGKIVWARVTVPAEAHTKITV